MLRKVDVLVPTFLRHESLDRFLTSLDDSRDLISKVIVVCYFSDRKSSLVASRHLCEVIMVNEKNTAKSIFIGAKYASNEYTAVFDDDVVVTRDWFTKCERYQSLGVGAVGGRDIIVKNPTECEEAKVGIMSLTGKFHGNHHCGAGNARSVDFLKGCNFMIRTAFLLNENIAFQYLRGVGAQVGNDLLITIRPRIARELVVYDPQMTVLHFTEPRINQDQREDFDYNARTTRAFNYWIIKLLHSPRFCLPLVVTLSLVIGTYETPGIIRTLIRHKHHIRISLKELALSIEQLRAARKMLGNERLPLPLRRQPLK